MKKQQQDSPPQPRYLFDHRTGSVLNRGIDLWAGSPIAPGGTPDTYWINLFDRDPEQGRNTLLDEMRIKFQRGPVAEAGVNGISDEALLTILIDRLSAFQKGPFACRENATALRKLEYALAELHHRARDRQARGVEGTHLP